LLESVLSYKKKFKIPDLETGIAHFPTFIALKVLILIPAIVQSIFSVTFNFVIKTQTY